MSIAAIGDVSTVAKISVTPELHGKTMLDDVMAGLVKLDASSTQVNHKIATADLKDTGDIMELSLLTNERSQKTSIFAKLGGIAKNGITDLLKQQ